MKVIKVKKVKFKMPASFRNNVFQKLEIIEANIDFVKKGIKEVIKKDVSIFFKQKIDEVTQGEIGNVYFDNDCRIDINYIRNKPFDADYAIETKIIFIYTAEKENISIGTVNKKILKVHEELYHFLEQKIDEIIKKEIGDEYSNHCWYCRAPIMDTNKKCPVCKKFFICSRCGYCLCKHRDKSVKPAKESSI